MKRENIFTIKSDLEQYNWVDILLNKTVEEQFNCLHDTLLHLFDKHCPEKEKTISSKHLIRETWLFKELIDCLNQQKALYKVYLTKKTTESEQRYKTYRNTLQKIIRKRKFDFYNEQCIEYKSNMKKLWSMINTVTKKSSDKSCIIDNLKINNIEYS